MTDRQDSSPDQRFNLLASRLNLMEATGQGAQIIPALRDFLNQVPGHLEALKALGRRHMEARDYPAAVAVHRELARCHPQLPEAHNSLSIALVMSGDSAGALAAVEQALALAPGFLVYRFNRAKMLMQVGRWIEATTELETLAPQAPPNVAPEVARLLEISRTQIRGEGAAVVPPVVSATPSAPTSVRPRPEAPLKMLLCCAEGMDNFVNDWIRGVSPEVTVTKLVTRNLADYRQAIKNSSLVWLEWGDKLAELLTKEAAADLASKRVICRIHSYEVLDHLADQLNFEVIDDLVFVAPHIKEIFLDRRPEVRSRVKRIHVIPNGVDVDRFPLRPRQPGFNLAYVGSLNFKKDPMVLMHAFHHLYRRDQRWRLHLAGEFQQDRYVYAYNTFLESNGLGHAVKHHGWISNMVDWLADKSHIILTSLMESQNMGVMEAMATGCQPLVYNFPGARVIYPVRFLWRNLDDLPLLLSQPYQPEEYRRFIVEHYSLEQQCRALLEMLVNRTVVDPGAVMYGSHWN